MIHQKLAVTAVLMALTLSTMSANAESGFYIGGNLGNADLNEDFDGLNIDTNSTSFGMVGGWRFNDYFSLEGGYHDFGNFEQNVDIDGVSTSVSLSAAGFTLGGTGSVLLGNKFSLHGRVGWFFWAGDAEVNNVSQATPEDRNLYFGSGVSYAVTDRFKVTGDWNRYDLDGVNSDVFSMGVQFSFGQ
jgi:OOP family OmpA-OmpF porin